MNERQLKSAAVSREEWLVASGGVGYNYGTSPYAAEDLPGVSVFYKNEAGEVFHTYSTYARGVDILLGSHNYLDLTPKGRNEVAGGDSAPDDPTIWRLSYHDRYSAADPAASNLQPVPRQDEVSCG